MVRTNITRQAKHADYDAAISTVTMAALDNTNGNAVSMNGDEVLLLHNPTGGSINITIGSAPLNGRTLDKTGAVAAGAYARVGPLPLPGWKQTDGKLYINASAPGLLAAVIAI